MISKGCLARSRRYSADVYLVISDPWKCSDQITELVNVLGIYGTDTVYVRDLEVISKG